MFKLMHGPCRLMTQTLSLHSPIQVAVCKVHALLPSSPTSLSQRRKQDFPATALLKITVPTANLPFSSPTRRKATSNSFTDVEPTSTHVFRIKPDGKAPVDPNAFSFWKVLTVPVPYMLYGLGGLIPFMSAPYYMHVIGLYSPGVAHAQLIYGATILSFLGGVSWGNQLDSPVKASLSSLRYSIMLPLIAWPAVLMHPHPAGFGLMIAGIVYAGVQDVRNVSYPGWFRSLRFLLSTLVSLSLGTTLIFSFTKKHRSQGSSSISNEEDEDCG